ncbi:MAG TPA: J domain-containing protein [Rhodanobacteraceae bacterium]|nr:J domain-containing protein [Rhodanobacteraceae bacterium]
MGAIKTHYDNLQVARNASPEVIRAAYKGLTQRYHPDRHSDDRARCERVMKIINEAFAVLSDPRKRTEHDAWIARQEAAEHATSPAQDNPDAAPARPDVPGYYADAAQAFRQSRVANDPAGMPRDMPRHVPGHDSVQQAHAAGAGGNSGAPPNPAAMAASDGRGTRAAKGRRWAWNVMKIVVLTVVLWLVFVYRGNTFKGVVEAALLVLVGLVCAGIAFGLGWASAKPQPVASASPAAIPPPGATRNARSTPSKWTFMDWFQAAVIALIVVGGVYTVVNRVASERPIATTRASVDLATATAEKLRVGVPRMVTSDQRLDSVTADPGRAVIYTYTMVGIPNLNMDAETASRFRQLIVASTCGGSSSDLFAHGIAIRDRYLRDDGQLVADVTIRPEDCPQQGSRTP